MRFIYLAVVLILITGCSDSKDSITNTQKYEWKSLEIENIFKDSCINSDNWKDKDPAEVMVEDRSLRITGFVDTSKYTPIPTALVVGFCAIGEGGGWGNELFLVGHNPKLQKPNYIIEEIFDETIGFTLSSENINKEKDGLRVELEGYSSKSEPACCRDVIDILEIKFEEESPKINFVSNNSYQAKKIILKINNE